jgi:hypothetical protein
MSATKPGARRDKYKSGDHWTHHDPAVRELIREHQAKAWAEGWKARGFDVPGMGSVTPNPYEGAA